MVSKGRDMCIKLENLGHISGMEFIEFEYTVFVPIEARRASAGISPSETVLISRENYYCDINTTYPLYITSFHCYVTY